MILELRGLSKQFATHRAVHDVSLGIERGTFFSLLGPSGCGKTTTLRLIAGLFVLLSLALGYWVNQYWYLFTAFVGLNLFQSGFTNWCPMMTFLRKLGLAARRN